MVATQSLVFDGSAGHDMQRPNCRFVPFRADAALRREWVKLEASASLPTQSHAFVQALQPTLLAGTPVSVLVARASEDAVALLPMCHDDGFFARLHAVGPLEVFEPVDALSQSEAGVAMLAAALVGQSRPLSLDRIPANSPLVPALRQAIRGKGWLSVRPAVPTPVVALDESWGKPEDRFNSRRRSDFRRAARKAEELGHVTCEVLSPTPDEFDALFDEAVAVELRSWKKDAGTALGADPLKQDFFRAFFRSASEQGSLRIAFLRIDGRAVAMQMAVESQGRYWLFKIGFDETFGRCSPGTLLMLHTIGWAARRGLRSYELLGQAEPWITELWTREQRECVRVRTYPLNLRGAVSFAADAATWVLARWKARTDAAA